MEIGGITDSAFDHAKLDIMASFVCDLIAMPDASSV